jgi:hypothetical protein
MEGLCQHEHGRRFNRLEAVGRQNFWLMAKGDEVNHRNGVRP